MPPTDLSDVERGDGHVVYLLYDVACVKKTLPRGLGGGAAGAEAQQRERRAIRQDGTDASVRQGLPVLIAPACLHWSLNAARHTPAINFGGCRHVLFAFDFV
jgi:hypothetical protein